MPRCDAISAGFDLCTNEPIAQGIDDIIYLWNRGDFTFTFDEDDPLLITAITRVGTALMYKYLGTNNSFNTLSKSVRTNVGPRYTEEIDFNIAGISSTVKNQVMAMGFGDLQAITVNNYRDGDSIFELFGAVNGLQDDGSERNAGDENFGGGYNMKLTNRPKLREPMLPRCVNIGSPATFATTLAALEALCIPAP